MIQSIENGRKEDGNRSIADKIIKRLHDLDKTVENNQGRWAWELLQNAKDSIADDDRTVSVQIQLDSDYVEFRHNGTHFTEQDVRGLINQISSKEIEEGQQTKKTGRFGTGFLTTHLLSKVIQIKGIVKVQSGDFYSFQFPLDREGKTTTQLVPKIENAWSGFHSSATKLTNNYNKDFFSTAFGYQLTSDGQREIARIGVEEFIKLIPFVLAFIPKIGKVEIINNMSGQQIVFENSQELLHDLIIPISKTENGVKSKIYILYATNNDVSIASELKKTTKGFAVKSNKDIPKLFCDFPLIGTESFHFPVIVNSFFFHPQTERDGIWLKGKKDDEDPEVTENQTLLMGAMNLYKELLPKVSEGNYFELYNLSETRMPNTNEKYFDDVWYKDTIQKPIRESVFNANLVELEDEEEGKKSAKDVWFPMKSYSSEVQQKMWQFTYDQFPNAVCKKSHLEQWCDISWESWNKLNYSELVKDIVKAENIEKLKESLGKNESDAFDWLNSLRKFILSDENNLSLFESNAITPNKNGTFKKKSELYIDNIKDDDLIIILQLLGEDWKEILIHDYTDHGQYSVREKKDVASRITDKLKSPQKNDDTNKAISLLSEWFENHNPDDSKALFSELYRNRAELFMNTINDKESLYKVMRSGTNLSELSRIAQTLAANPQLADDIQGAAQLSSLFSEFNISSIDELKTILRQRNEHSGEFQKMELTQEVLASLGVTTAEELEKALQDKHLASMFRHISTPKVEMFLYAQNLIERAKTNVMNHVKTLSIYDCRDMEELSTSVIGGVKKEGLSIHIVIRPSDFGQVIVYYDAEKDTLDYANAELWIENGKDQPKLLTLGKILKNTGINKIPV